MRQTYMYEFETGRGPSKTPLLRSNELILFSNITCLVTITTLLGYCTICRRRGGGGGEGRVPHYY
jgi:hypothetical protein